MADVDAGPPVTDLAITFGGKGGVGAFEIVEAAPEPDTTPPYIENLTPATGTTLSAGATIQFDAIDPGGTLAVVTLFADFLTSMRDEVVFDGLDFGRLYSGTRTVISDGWQFTFTRRGGFPASDEQFRLRVVAYDTAGNAVVLL